MFKMIYNIARAELAMLFYSPVAWLLLVVFGVQAGLLYSFVMPDLAKYADMGRQSSALTSILFSSKYSGILSIIQQNLFLYIPLLTMSLVSKELSSGSIKLLYSSPITNTHIILGKFLSIAIYGLCMLGVLLIIAIVNSFFIKDFDWPLVLVGLWGMHLLICANAAVGIFMSSLTSYQIVAAIGTYAILTVLNLVGNWWQSYEFVREITYWLSMSGRSTQFIQGMVCSEDVLYFIIVIGLFLALTIIRLNAVRQKIAFKITFVKNVSICLLVCILGYITSLPQMKVYYDATATKSNTLTKNSQDIVKKLDGDVTITTYINVLEPKGNWYCAPRFWNLDKERFEQYLRFKPDMKLEYVYYYDEIANPQLDAKCPNGTLREKMIATCNYNNLDSNQFITPEEIRKKVDLSEEGNRFIRQIVRENGQKAWLRVYDDGQMFPDEKEISAAFKRMIMRLPKVAFLTGHGVRDYQGDKDIDYNLFASNKHFRNALENQGFEVTGIDLKQEIPSDVNILVIADIREKLNEEEEMNFKRYIEKGGNLLMLGEPKHREAINPLFKELGFELEEGIIVKHDTIASPDLILNEPLKEIVNISYVFNSMIKYKSFIATSGACNLKQIEDKGFKVTEMFRTRAVDETWNELQTENFIDETVQYNPEKEEKKGVFTTIVALERNLGDKSQRIILGGDADCISNNGFRTIIKGERVNNFQLIPGCFSWFSHNEAPIDVRRPSHPDNMLYLGKEGAEIMVTIFKIIIPILLALAGLMIWIRRKGR